MYRSDGNCYQHFMLLHCLNYEKILQSALKNIYHLVAGKIRNNSIRRIRSLVETSNNAQNCNGPV
jgi:hypothetical protein